MEGYLLYLLYLPICYFFCWGWQCTQEIFCINPSRQLYSSHFATLQVFVTAHFCSCDSLCNIWPSFDILPTRYYCDSHIADNHEGSYLISDTRKWGQRRRRSPWPPPSSGARCQFAQWGTRQGFSWGGLRWSAQEELLLHWGEIVLSRLERRWANQRRLMPLVFWKGGQSWEEATSELIKTKHTKVQL